MQEWEVLQHITQAPLNEEGRAAEPLLRSQASAVHQVAQLAADSIHNRAEMRPFWAFVGDK